VGGRARYIIKQLLQHIINLFLIVTFNFLLFRLLPGDPMRKLFRDPRVPAATMKAIAHSFGLDQPVWKQYLLYLQNLVHGNWGMSFSFDQPVWGILSQRLINTLLLMVTANILAILLGVWLGVFAAKNRGRLEDVLGMGAGLLFWSMPTSWIGMIVVVLFVGILPISGMTDAGATYANGLDYTIALLQHMLLPTITLALVLLGQYAIIMRNSLSVVMTEDYITTAKAKGFDRNAIFRRYAIPNARLPLVTLIAVNLGLSVAGAVQAEIVFGWPGLGTLVYQAVLSQDYPILQGAFLLISFAVVLANFVSDIIYTSLDPRIKAN